MKIERFRQLVAAHGAEASRWPAAERASALEFLAMSAEARDLVESESRLDGVLALSHAPAVAGSLLGRIVLNATAQPQAMAPPARVKRNWLSLDFGFGRLWQQAAGLAACALLGVFVGLSGVLDVPTSDASEYDMQTLMTDDLPFDGEAQ